MVAVESGWARFSEIWGELVCLIGAWGDEACVVYMYVDKERARLRRQSCFPPDRGDRHEPRFAIFGVTYNPSLCIRTLVISARCRPVEMVVSHRT